MPAERPGSTRRYVRSWIQVGTTRVARLMQGGADAGRIYSCLETAENDALGDLSSRVRGGRQKRTAAAPPVAWARPASSAREHWPDPRKDTVNPTNTPTSPERFS